MERIKHFVSALFAGVTVSTVMGWMPDIAALLGVLWYLTQFWDWIAAQRNKKKHLARRSTDR